VALVHLSSSFDRLEELADFLSLQSSPVTLSITDADTVICVASLKDQWHGPVGVWLRVSGDYSASLLARDVKTLSWIVDLEHVVVEAERDSEAHAQVVRALLSDDEVNVTNDVATITKAYNRPAPPRPVTVWAAEGTLVGCEDESLRLMSNDDMTIGKLARFA
jgi:hypothetical protein